jgi:PKD repeat protein
MEPINGNVIHSYVRPEPGIPSGLTWDGTYLWNADFETNKIYKLNPLNGSVLYAYDAPSSAPAGLAWDGTYLWNTDVHSKKIYKLAVQPPIAEFTWTPQEPYTNEIITFNATNSSDPNGIITLYEWDWNNDGIYDDTSTTPNITHSWPTHGTYPITLQVTDDTNLTGIISKTVEIFKTPYDLSFEIQGGFGIEIIIINHGSETAIDIPWNLQVTGGILGLINTDNSGTTDIPPTDTVTIGTSMLLGLGEISIKAIVNGEEKTATGIQLLVYSIIN